MFIASIFRTVAIYLGLVQPDTGDLCISCQFDLAHRGGAFCGECAAGFEDLGEANCLQCKQVFPVTVDEAHFCSNKCYTLWCNPKCKHGVTVDEESALNLDAGYDEWQIGTSGTVCSCCYNISVVSHHTRYYGEWSTTPCDSCK